LPNSMVQELVQCDMLGVGPEQLCIDSITLHGVVSVV
jgi:hypothetical protein